MYSNCYYNVLQIINPYAMTVLYAMEKKSAYR